MSEARSAPSCASLLRCWLHGTGRGTTVQERWAALEALSERADLATRLRLAALIIEGERVHKMRIRRRAATALLRVCAHAPPPDSGRLQTALARSLAFALPRRLATPRLVEQVMAPDECQALIESARENGSWGSLHRKYSTVDLPLEKLDGGAAILDLMRRRVLPHYPLAFGRRFGPAADLAFVSCFVVRYTADKGGQAGLAGHVDESFVSFVLQLSDDADYEGGGTRFERAGVLNPGRGNAILFLGRVWHEAVPISRGERYVLVGLLNRRTTPGGGEERSP